MTNINMSESEIKQCQNCKAEFEIADEDTAFYRKIDVPAPTWCPECRLQRRLAGRNIRNLYKNKCNAPGHNEQLLAIYSENSGINVYDHKYWWSDEWDPMEYGREYDFSTPFFEQFYKLLKEVPLPNISNTNSVNSEYVNVTQNSKDCYLVFSSSDNENCFYSYSIAQCRDSADLMSSNDSERLYESVDCRNCFNVSFSKNAIACSDSAFLYDCRNCSNCFGCWNLRNKKYHIFNEPYSKEDYFKKIKDFDTGSFNSVQKIKSDYNNRLKNALTKFADIIHSDNVVGDKIENSKNCQYAFDINGVADSKYVFTFLGGGGSNDHDVSIAITPELCYECCGVSEGYRCRFGIAAVDTRESNYVFSCISGCSNLFGCVGLRNAKYCILNRQYTKEEYEALIPKIKTHMNEQPYIDQKGREYKYGEFFPPELSPFAYNETIAQEYFPLDKEEAKSQGYKWRDKEKPSYSITLKPGDIPDNIEDTEDKITEEVIECIHNQEKDHPFSCQAACTTAFKIIPQELQFYRQMNLALPRACPNCRHYERLSQRNPLKLWHRKCQCAGDKSDPPSRTGIKNKELGIKEFATDIETNQQPTTDNLQQGTEDIDNKESKTRGTYTNTSKNHPDHGPDEHCPNEFQTSYSPDRKEIIYCEACYQSEVV